MSLPLPLGKQLAVSPMHPPLEAPTASNPLCRITPLSDLTRIQAGDALVERVRSGDCDPAGQPQATAATEIERLLTLWRAAIEPDDDAPWRKTK